MCRLAPDAPKAGTAAVAAAALWQESKQAPAAWSWTPVTDQTVFASWPRSRHGEARLSLPIAVLNWLYLAHVL
jgi:hypothetical protein